MAPVAIGCSLPVVPAAIEAALQASHTAAGVGSRRPLSMALCLQELT